MVGETGGLISAHWQGVMKFLVGPALTKTNLRPTLAASPKLGVFAKPRAVLRKSINESCLFFMIGSSLPGLLGNMGCKRYL